MINDVKNILYILPPPPASSQCLSPFSWNYRTFKKIPPALFFQNVVQWDMSTLWFFSGLFLFTNQHAVSSVASQLGSEFIYCWIPFSVLRMKQAIYSLTEGCLNHLHFLSTGNKWLGKPLSLEISLQIELLKYVWVQQAKHVEKSAKPFSWESLSLESGFIFVRLLVCVWDWIWLWHSLWTLSAIGTIRSLESKLSNRCATISHNLNFVLFTE